MVKRVNDAGFKALLENLKDAENLVIEAGIFADARASRSANGSAADRLAYRLKIHDQGLGKAYKGKSPRAVLEPAREDFLDDFNGIMKPHFARMNKAGEVKKGARSAGQRFAAQIKLQFAKTRPKLPATIEASRRKYGSSRGTPLVQTAEMRKAVKWRVR